MCYIEGPVEFMFGHCKRGFDGLDDRATELAEAALRTRIKATIDAVEGLAPTVGFRDIDPLLSDDLRSFLETHGGLPMRAYTLFVEHQLAILNAHRPDEDRIWFDPHDPRAEGCCFYKPPEDWQPCRIHGLYQGSFDERRPWRITAEAGGLESPVSASMQLHVSWRMTIDGAGFGADASESTMVSDRAGERGKPVLTGMENR